MVQFWRQSGLNYLKYSNLCAMMMRRCYKEPHKTKALERDQVAFGIAKWQNGKATKAGKKIIILKQEMSEGNSLRCL
jgi:F-type H+-transporting ATPase subunit epsilon